MNVLYKGKNDSRHRISDVPRDKQTFSRSADRTHWWNLSDYVPRGGRRF